MKYIKNIKKYPIQGLIEIELNPYSDPRGQIWSIYEECDMLPTFVEDKVTISNKGVLRGLHGDFETDKLICCMHGDLFLSVADIRRESNTFKETQTFYLSDDNPTIVLVPAGCLNGHLCLSDKCIFFYKWSEKYKQPDDQITVLYSDPELSIPWPTDAPILSERDSRAKILREMEV